MENSINTTMKDFICDLLSENRKLAEALENANTMKDYWCEQYKKENEYNGELIKRNDDWAKLYNNAKKRIAELEANKNE